MKPPASKTQSCPVPALAEIPFNKPFIAGDEIEHILRAYQNQRLAGNGQFTKECQDWLKTYTNSRQALLTHTGTAALEMASLLTNIQPGDEIIMPSYTFVTTATAFVLRGAVPVFVDIRADTCNIDETKIEQAITSKTKAIVPVHYAGIGCDMDAIMAIARKHKLFVIEDAAHGLGAKYKGRELGSIGDLGALSFHETKNVIAGEGGCLLINQDSLIDRAFVLADKGTNRQRFMEGHVDKYTWLDIGSSFYPSELTAAFLWSQLKHLDFITQSRTAIWNRYHDALRPFEENGFLRRPHVPADCQPNAHLYYIVLPSNTMRQAFIHKLREQNIHAVFHYVPLHSSPAGQTFGRAADGLEVTNSIAQCLVRLPLWVGLESHLDMVLEKILIALKELRDGLSS